MSHTLDVIIESIRRDGFSAGMRLLWAEMHHKGRFCLLERRLGPDCSLGDVAEKVKLADPSHLDRIVAAWPEEFGGAKGDGHVRRKIARRFENGYPCLISERDGRVEGAVWCVPWEWDGQSQSGEKHQEAFEICNLFVTPECRGRGVGQRLLTQALSLMTGQGKKTAYSRVLPERHASIVVHLNAGFRVLGVMHCVTTLGQRRCRLVPLTKAGLADIRGMEMPACVLLAQSAWGGTLEAVRSLGMRGVPVYVFVLGRDPTPYARSRYCCHASRLTGQDAASVSQRLIDWCKAQKFSRRPLLLPMTDILSTFVAEERQSLEGYFTVGAARPETVLSLLDKGRANALAASCGLDVPQSTIVKTHADLKTMAAIMKYPAIAKPTWWREKGRANFKAVTFKTPKSLITGLAPVLDGGTSVLVQEYVQGTDQDIEAFMFYRDRRGVVWGCTSRKLRQSPPNAGIMASGHAVDLLELRQRSSMFLDTIDYHGLGGVEFKRCGRRLAYIEMSVRPEAFHGLSRKAGLDLVWIAYCDYCLGGLGEKPYSQREAFYLNWSALWTSYGLRNVVPWAMALLWMLSKRPLKTAIFDLRDPEPSLCLIRRGLWERFGRALKKFGQSVRVQKTMPRRQGPEADE